VIRVDKLQWMRIARSDGQLAPPASATYEFDFFKQLEQVTDDYLEGQPGYATRRSAERAVTESDPLERVIRLCERFPRAARELARRGRGRSPLTMDDEYDVQYVLQALLALEFDDVRDETWTPDYAGGSARQDFLLPFERIVVEAKRTRDSQTTRQLGDELLIDIGRYGADSRCDTLVCFIYDPEHRVDNPRGLEADVTGTRENLDVIVLVAPLI
jgi:DpnII restriction endonuclease